MMTEKAKEKKESVYERLSKIDVKPYLDTIKSKKGFSLSYLSWAKAWGLVKAIYPDASYKIKEYPNWIDTKQGVQQAGTLDYRITKAGCEVETTVTIEGVDYTQKLYPMDYRNNPIMNPNIKDINKAQLRCLVKALATAGLGLNVYAGEDLPSNETETAKREDKKQATPRKPARKSTAKPNFKTLTEKELENYTVMYRTDADAKPMEFKLLTIYTMALTGDKTAESWFHVMIKKLNTPEGQAAAQFAKSHLAAQIKEEIEKKRAAKEIQEATQKAEA